MEFSTNIAFCITYFRRPELFRSCLRSIGVHYPHAHIYVADDSGDEDREAEYLSWSEGFEYIWMPFDSGVAAKRNALVDAAHEDYVFILEDDFEFTERTRVEYLWSVLHHANSVEIIGGRTVGPDGRDEKLACDFEFKHGDLTLHPPAKDYREVPAANAGGQLELEGRVRHVPVDMTAHFLLARREFLKRNPWDPETHIGEHIPWFLDLHDRSRRGQIAFTPDVSVVNRGGGSEYYERKRKRSYNYYRRALRARGIERVHNRR